jgi:hypothetical protein
MGLVRADSGLEPALFVARSENWYDTRGAKPVI